MAPGVGRPAAPCDALVHDARADFGGGGQDALLAALETLWETIANVANASLIPSGDGGKVVLIAPEDGAGAYADAARAAIENLARTLSTEWARYGITATAVTPRAGDPGGRIWRCSWPSSCRGPATTTAAPGSSSAVAEPFSGARCGSYARLSCPSRLS